MVSMLGEEQSLIQQLTRLATDADGNGSLDRTEFDTLTRRLLTVATQCQQVRRQLQLDPAVATISRAALPRLQDMQTEQSNFKSLAMTLQNPNASIKDLRRTLVDLDLAVSRSTRRTGALLA
ncbi:hypothetical protein BCR37DRAFT_379704 [Protomyces lactucae-debilis]|uniref:EF-hand domain-containing protein n=1 Tax=Protomyces lactucae-debilis TaxID=2754530 RepID=A0A1Y2FFI6_PROLT|nr:uncharacterized protein BCR37DRAFT_379704 [Protomyces lactucae-debilis]ORY82681.1 hypothetical protein BCR37DRAFT_379704 [Protomyces lactucae-debilis]